MGVLVVYEAIVKGVSYVAVTPPTQNYTILHQTNLSYAFNIKIGKELRAPFYLVIGRRATH